MTVRVLVWLVVLAFVLGGFGGWIAGGSGQSVRIDPLSSLSVFDGPHTAADDSRILGPMTIVVEGSAATTVTDIRHLRTVIGFALFGALGSKDIYGVATPMVCMSVESTNTGGMACVTRDEFVTKGVEVRTGTGGDLFGPTFHWGPVGPPMQLQVSDAGSS